MKNSTHLGSGGVVLSVGQKSVDIVLILIYNGHGIYIAQDMKCALSGIPIVFANSMKLVQSGNTTASIDRKDSNIGYIEDNVQWVHKDINMMKQKMSNSELIKYCKLIVEYNK